MLPQQKRESLVQSMCDAIVKLALNVDLRKEMGRKAHQAGKQFVWNERENKYEMLSIAIFIAKTINVCTYDQLPKENHLFPPFQ